MQIVRKKLSEQELNPPNTRYVILTDTVQTLVDGTWVDTPAADPRTSASALLPPRTTGDPRCDAAANMTAKVKSIVDYYLATAEQALFVSGVLTIISLFFPLVGLIAEALWTIADVLVGLGVVVVGGAMTSTVYDHLTCYFYDQLNSSGQLDQTGFDAVLSAVAAGESGTVYDVIAAVFSGLGWVGIDNAGATGSEIGDCGACFPQWEFFPDGTYQDGSRGRCVAAQWVSSGHEQDGSSPSSGEIMMRVVLAPTTVTRISVTYTKSVGTNTESNQDLMIINSPNGWYNGTQIEVVNPGATHTASPWTWTGSEVLTGGITIWMFSSCYYGDGSWGDITISHVEIDTTDGNYVWDNC